MLGDGTLVRPTPFKRICRLTKPSATLIQQVDAFWRTETLDAITSKVQAPQGLY